MDTTKLRLGEVVAGASAILLFIVMFFHWYGVKGVVFGQTVEVGGVSAWRVYSYVDILLLILIILALGMVLLSATQRSTALPISTNVVVTGYGAIMTLIVLYRVVINQPGPDNLISVKFWGYVGLLLTAGVAVGAFMAMREEGTSFSDAAQRLQGATGAGAAPQPAPPQPPAQAPQPPPQAPPPGDQPAPPQGPPPSQPPPGGGAPPTG